MAVFLQPIYTQTVGAGGASSVTFNNIPQTFTDLMVVCSTRCDGAVTAVTGGLRFNNDSTSIYSDTWVGGTGSTVASNRHQTSFGYAIDTPGTSATSNTFGSCQIYIANYAGSNFKTYISDQVSENNGTTAWQDLYAGLWRSTSAITSIILYPGGGYNFVQYSTFSLYGILRSGV